MLPGRRTQNGALFGVNAVPPVGTPLVGGIAVSPMGVIYMNGLAVAWDPSSLFAASEVGAWYDPSDMTTLFQDSAGTTPVTAVEQPVGLILDKSKGLVLGAEQTVNGSFTADTDWTKAASWTISGGVASTTGAVGERLIQSTTTNLNIVFGKTYEVSGTVTGGGIGIILGQASFIDAVLGAGTFNIKILAGLLGGAEIPTYLAFRCNGAAATIDNISVKELPGNHSKQATSTKRPVLKQDGNGKYYLAFDGVDDALATASIDFTATDKMSVFAGVRKLSDAARASLFTHNGTGFNSFGAEVPNATAANNYMFYCLGSSAGRNPGAITKVAPITNVVSVIYDIADTGTSYFRIDAVAAVANSASLTGNAKFTNNPLFIGQRNGSDLPFNGHLYSLIVRGALSSAFEITEAEKWVADKTGVTLP